ncbi:unnamed protein product [Schistocephalus solidus]|uniref:NADPH:adrenodoxin oxidoreductase, mitochondrial n=1 Tax=Schistocephalus solidus TaxID=70667 RepID=A0A183T9Z6_SCHSO|nr:unnamed protein product [Schistocephalus solidus]
MSICFSLQPDYFSSVFWVACAYGIRLLKRLIIIHVFFLNIQYHKELRVDILEKLPTPFGLVRYGVAPDHQDVKNVISTFTQVAENPRLQYWGNVTVGKDVKLRELREAYDAVLLAYGASLDKRMNIEGEDLRGVLSAKDFVGWYNGFPPSSMSAPDLDCETVAVVGMGNVALDVARILLSPIERLGATDIPESVLAVLSTSRVRRVVVVGRRGPLQVAFTLKEFRELTQLPSLRHIRDPDKSLSIKFTPSGVLDAVLGTGSNLEQLIESLPRPRRRLTQFLLSVDAAQQQCTLKRDVDENAQHRLSCEFRFLRSPVRVLSCPNSNTTPSSISASRVAALELAVNRLEPWRPSHILYAEVYYSSAPNFMQGPAGNNQRAVRDPQAPLERLECGLVIRSIGYRSLRIDDDLPFDEARGVVACLDKLGRVDVSALTAKEPAPALLYASGWSKRGPIGVLVETSTDARLTAEAMLLDLAELDQQRRLWPSASVAPGFDRIQELLRQRGVKPVTFADWQRIDCAEKAAGEIVGKPREKFTSLSALLQVAFMKAKEDRRSK